MGLLLSAQFWLYTEMLLEAQGSWLEDELKDSERIMLLSGLITKPVMMLLQSTHFQCQHLLYFNWMSVVMWQCF